MRRSLIGLRSAIADSHTPFLAVGNYRLHGCTLTVRITPDFHEMYRTNVDFTSAKVAKEAATRLALQEGIVTLLKLHNSFTSKICRQLGLPVPLTLEEHDPVEEENSAGTLGQLVQEVTRNPLAMECEYTTAIRDGSVLASLTCDLHDESDCDALTPIRSGTARRQAPHSFQARRRAAVRNVALPQIEERCKRGGMPASSKVWP